LINIKNKIVKTPKYIALFCFKYAIMFLQTGIIIPYSLHI